MLLFLFSFFFFFLPSRLLRSLLLAEGLKRGRTRVASVFGSSTFCRRACQLLIETLFPHVGRKRKKRQTLWSEVPRSNTLQSMFHLYFLPICYLRFRQTVEFSLLRAILFFFESVLRIIVTVRFSFRFCFIFFFFFFWYLDVSNILETSVWNSFRHNLRFVAFNLTFSLLTMTVVARHLTLAEYYTHPMSDAHCVLSLWLYSSNWCLLGHWNYSQPTNARCIYRRFLVIQ